MFQRLAEKKQDRVARGLQQPEPGFVEVRIWVEVILPAVPFDRPAMLCVHHLLDSCRLLIGKVITRTQEFANKVK